LVDNPKGTFIKQKEMEEIIKPFIKTIIERGEIRDSILAARELNKSN